MENQIDKVKDIADGMIGIGGIPSNEEFYAEFDMRVRAALGITPVSGRSEHVCHHPKDYRIAKSDINYECSLCGKFV